MVTTSEAAHAGVDSAAAETSNALKADFIFRTPLAKAEAVRSCREILVTLVSRGLTGPNTDRSGGPPGSVRLGSPRIGAYGLAPLGSDEIAARVFRRPPSRRFPLMTAATGIDASIAREASPHATFRRSPGGNSCSTASSDRALLNR